MRRILCFLIFFLTLLPLVLFSLPECILLLAWAQFTGDIGADWTPVYERWTRCLRRWAGIPEPSQHYGFPHRLDSFPTMPPCKPPAPPTGGMGKS
jgi:hypothetical protein